MTAIFSRRARLDGRLLTTLVALAAVGLCTMLRVPAIPVASAQVPPPGAPPAGAAKPRLLVIGDSVLEGTFGQVQVALPDWDVTVDAHMNRNTGDGPAVLASHGTAFDAVFVQLGTNDAGSAAVYQPRVKAMMDALAPVPRVYWLTIHEVRDYYATANQIVRTEAASHKNVTVVDWNVAVRPGDTYDDGLHLTPQGAVSMSQVIAGVLHGTPIAGTLPVTTTATVTTVTTTTTTAPTAAATSTDSAAPASDGATQANGGHGASAPTARVHAASKGSGGFSVLLAAGLLCVVVVAAGVPMLLVRRRRALAAGAALQTDHD